VFKKRDATITGLRAAVWMRDCQPVFLVCCGLLKLTLCDVSRTAIFTNVLDAIMVGGLMVGEELNGNGGARSKISVATQFDLASAITSRLLIASQH
jgi:hypothetical protein